MISANGAPVLTELTAGHLHQAVSLSSEMGWPYRLEDWAFAHRLGRGLALEQSGRLIGTAMRWDYGDDCTSVGMVIVAKAFQKRGYGALLVDALLEDAKAKTVFLNATQEALALYRRRGFRCTGIINQHQGVPRLLRDIDQPHQIKIADSADLTNVLALDHDALGMPRAMLLRSLAEAGQILELTDRGVASGFAAYRAFGRGFVIGPVVAPRLDDACQLMDAAIARLSGDFVRVDTPADSGLTPWLEARGLARVDSVSAMVRGAQPQPSGQARVFALSSQSLG